MLYEVIIYVVWNAVDLYILNMNLTNRRLLSMSNADARFVCAHACGCARLRVSGLMYLRLKMVL